jgi:hypothetical protein
MVMSGGAKSYGYGFAMSSLAESVESGEPSADFTRRFWKSF